jgi:hypothetical protein
MKADDPDPVQRWLKVHEFYSDFAAKPGWGFLSPMVGLVEWVAYQPMAALLYPRTSHEWLTVSFVPDYDPETPFVVAISRGDGQFECELFAAVAEPVDIRIGPLEHAREIFVDFAGRLRDLSESSPDRPH